MRKVFKALFAALFIFAVAVFSLVGWGKATIPDELYIASDGELDVNEVFTVSIDDCETAVRETESRHMYNVSISLLNAIPVKSSTLTVSQRRYVVPGGSIIGLKLYTKGVIIVGMDEVQTNSGLINPAAQAGMAKGDSIISIDGQQVSTTSEVAGLFAQSMGKKMNVVFERDGNDYQTSFSLVMCSTDGRYKAGLWIRDSAAGIGTMTYYDRQTGVYGSLGHAVCDIDTGSVMNVSNGECVCAEITGCYKATNGCAGELCGVFINGSLGSLSINCQNGVFGVLSDFDENAGVVPVATASEVKTGKAQIIATVDKNAPQLYDIEITKLYTTSQDENRSMSIRVTDKRLIEYTGGIVQGMSGSPIIQNGMLVGAVTHVFVNDSTQGYAIYAEKMMETSDSLAASLINEAA